jgi:hypothetical protein
MKKIIYLLMSLSIVALASCNDDKENPVNSDNTQTENGENSNNNSNNSSGNGSGASAVTGIKEMSGKTLVIKETYSSLYKSDTEEFEYTFDNNGRLSKIESDGVTTYTYDYSKYPVILEHQYDKGYYSTDSILISYNGTQSKNIKIWSKGDVDYLYYDRDYSYDSNGRLINEHCNEGWSSGEEYKFEYDSNGNPVKKLIHTASYDSEEKYTFTDVKVSNLPIEDRIALSYCWGDANIAYCDVINHDGKSSKVSLIANTLLEKYEWNGGETYTYTYTYYLSDKKMKIVCSDGATWEYSWYVK